MNFSTLFYLLVPFFSEGAEEQLCLLACRSAQCSCLVGPMHPSGIEMQSGRRNSMRGLAAGTSGLTANESLIDRKIIPIPFSLKKLTEVRGHSQC